MRSRRRRKLDEEKAHLARRIRRLVRRMPVKMTEVDFAHEPQAEPVPFRYGTVRILVRLAGAPVGYLNLLNRGDGLSAGGLRRAAAQWLGSTTWANALRSRWNDGAPHSTLASDRLPISVIVCTRGRSKLLAGCLDTLARQSYSDFEVIVVDNAPTDDSTRLVAESYSTRYVLEPRPGLDWARNAGWRAARSPIVAYIDDDARADPDWLQGIAGGFTAPEVHAVTGLVVAAELETVAQRIFEYQYGGMGKGFRSLIHSSRGRTLVHRPHQYGVGCNMAFRKSALLAIGGFDPALDVGTPTGGGGDLDVFQRIVEADGAIVYRPDAIVRHIHRRSMRQLRRQVFDNGRGYGATFTAMLLRARGRARLGVLHSWSLWWGYYFVIRLIRWAIRLERLPLRLILIELAGFAIGPFLYPAVRRKADKLRSHEEP